MDWHFLVVLEMTWVFCIQMALTALLIIYNQDALPLNDAFLNFHITYIFQINQNNNIWYWTIEEICQLAAVISFTIIYSYRKIPLLSPPRF